MESSINNNNFAQTLRSKVFEFTDHALLSHAIVTRSFRIYLNNESTRNFNSTLIKREDTPLLFPRSAAALPLPSLGKLFQETIASRRSRDNGYRWRSILDSVLIYIKSKLLHGKLYRGVILEIPAGPRGASY